MELIKNLVPIIGILSAIALPIASGMYLGIQAMRSKHRENLELIKQGIVPQKNPKPVPKPVPNRYRSLRNGFLCIGIGLGLVVGLVVVNNYEMSDRDQVFVIGAPILIFLGLAYVLFFGITKDKNFDE